MLATGVGTLATLTTVGTARVAGLGRGGITVEELGILFPGLGIALDVGGFLRG